MIHLVIYTLYVLCFLMPKHIFGYNARHLSVNNNNNMRNPKEGMEHWRLRSLDLGPCLQEGDAYCMRRVANSMCSIEKNECFCKPGYVSIQESYGITCKTLLTNLKCQVDSDCVHVINSACHPGAGYCACPGGTIYVPQDHACRQSAENNQNQFCSKCRQVNGVCYYYYYQHNNNNNNYHSPSSSSSSSSPSSWFSFSGSSASASQTTNSEGFNPYKRYMYKNHDLVPFTSQIDTVFNGFLKYAHNTEMFGCSCPHNTGMLASIPSVNFLKKNQSQSRDSQNQSNVESHDTKDAKIHALVPQSFQELPQWYFCKAIIVDIWEYCNHVDILCRAKNARCVKTEHSSNVIQFSCQCLPGYIPVYQKHLNYYECFRQLEANHSSCRPCFHSSGKCYTMNEQNIDSSIGCLCPNNLQPTLTTSTPTDLIHHSHTNNDNKESNNNDRSDARNTFMTALLPTHTGVEYEMCGENLVNVFCQRHLLEICLSPISQPPYQNLAENLHLRRSVAFVTNLTFHQNFIDTCRLDVKLNSLQGKQWNHTSVNPMRTEQQQQHQVLCKTIDWRQDPTTTPCGISITEYMSGHLYTGYLAVITSHEHRNQESDLLFQFTCKTNNDVPHRVPGQVFERNLDNDKEDLFKDSSWPKLDVKLSIKDENGQSVQTILESAAVRFEAELIDELNIYKAVIVEECYMIDELESAQANEGSKETLLLYKGCPMFSSELASKSTISFNFQTNHYGNEQALIFRSTDNLHHIQTGLFRLYPNYSSIFVDGKSRTVTTGSNYTFTHDRTMKLTFEQMNSIDETFKQKLSEIGQRLHELKFTCIFRVCKQLAWCSWPSACDSTLTSLNNPRITFLPPGVRIIQRSVPLYLIESVPSIHLPVKKQAKSKVCEELFCSNTLHIVLMMGLVGILTCLMGVMGMLLARKYRHRLHQTRDTFLRSKTKMKPSNHSSAPPPPAPAAPGTAAAGGHHYRGVHHHHQDQQCLQCSETKTQSLLSKSYYNPIIQSTITQHLLHYKQHSEHQSENGVLKSLLTVDNNIDTTINGSSNKISSSTTTTNNNNSDNSNMNPSCTVGMKDCCKYWLNEHSYANPLLIKNSSNDLSQYHSHLCHQQGQHGQQVHTAIQPQQQHQLSSSSSGATPSHCSCLSDIVLNDRTKGIQNSHNYYTFKRYTTLPPTTTLTPFNTTSFMKENESGLVNKTTTFLLEPMNPLIHTNAITTNNITGNIHDRLTTTPYPTTFTNNNNSNDDNSKHSMFFCCPEQLTNRHDASLLQHKHKQLYSQAERYGNLDSAVSGGGNDEGFKNVNSVYNTNNNSNSNDNKPEISLHEYKKLTNPSNDTVYFGVDYPNSSYTINPLDLTLCTDSLHKLQAQTQSNTILQSILGQPQPQQQHQHQQQHQQYVEG